MKLFSCYSSCCCGANSAGSFKVEGFILAHAFRLQSLGHAIGQNIMVTTCGKGHLCIPCTIRKHRDGKLPGITCPQQSASVVCFPPRLTSKSVYKVHKKHQQLGSRGKNTICGEHATLKPYHQLMVFVLSALALVLSPIAFPLHCVCCHVIFISCVSMEERRYLLFVCITFCDFFTLLHSQVFPFFIHVFPQARMLQPSPSLQCSPGEFHTAVLNILSFPLSLQSQAASQTAVQQQHRPESEEVTGF